MYYQWLGSLKRSSQKKKRVHAHRSVRLRLGRGGNGCNFMLMTLRYLQIIKGNERIMKTSCIKYEKKTITFSTKHTPSLDKNVADAIARKYFTISDVILQHTRK